MMTAQEMFDKVAVHMVTQNKKSLNEHGFCRYRGEGNTKCAAGCLLSDEDYNIDFEGGTTYSPIVQPTFIKIVGVENLDLLRELQQIHDDVVPNQWTISLRNIAKKYALLTDCLKSFECVS